MPIPEPHSNDNNKDNASAKSAAKMPANYDRFIAAIEHRYPTGIDSRSPFWNQAVKTLLIDKYHAGLPGQSIHLSDLIRAVDEDLINGRTTIISDPLCEADSQRMAASIRAVMNAPCSAALYSISDRLSQPGKGARHADS